MTKQTNLFPEPTPKGPIIPDMSEKVYISHNPIVGKKGPETSRKAAKKADKIFRTRNIKIVFDIIYENPWLNKYEIAELAPFNDIEVSRRCTDLQAMGKIRPVKISGLPLKRQGCQLYEVI